MKKLIILFLLCFIGISTSCTNDNSTDDLELKSTAEIIGPDMRLCACCGGWLIKIDEDFYDFYDLPETSNINLQNATFPVSVKLNWRFDQNSFCPDDIIIEQIELN